MAGKRIDIMDLHSLIKLKSKGFSNRRIADLLGVSRNTVNSYIQLLDGNDLNYNELSEFSNKDLYDLLPTKDEIESYRYKTLSSKFTYFQKELKRPGCTRKILWEEYIQNHPDGYQKSQFNYHLNKWLAKKNGSLKLTHKAGEKLYIDFTGKKLSYTDKETGEIVELEVFVGVLPASGYTFAYAVRSQKIADLLEALKECLNYIGGVPLAIVPDNLKSAVTKSHKYAPKINDSLRHFAHHYGCTIDPTRPYSPQDKALVENAVKLIYQRIYYPIRNFDFHSLSSVNTELRKYLDDFNKHKLSQLDSTREKEFYDLEKQELQPLPTEDYQLHYFKQLKVHKMGHIYLNDDKHYYSVPYRHIGENVTVSYSSNTVEIYSKKKRIAVHKRNYKKGGYTTEPNHLSSQHQFYEGWSLSYFQKQSERIGKYTHVYITELIQGKPYPEQAYKQALGIIHLEKDYTSNRIESACELALEHELSKGYYSIKNILENNQDINHNVNQTETLLGSHIPSHQNIRGSFK